MNPKILSQNDYMLIQYDEAHQIFEYHWTEKNADLSDDEYQDLMRGVMRFVHEIKPTRVIVNAKESKFTIKIEMQAWITENVMLAAAKAGMRKLAIILSDELIPGLSMQQSIEDADEKAVETRYFNHLDLGREWLQSIAQKQQTQQ